MGRDWSGVLTIVQMDTAKNRLELDCGVKLDIFIAFSYFLYSKSKKNYFEIQKDICLILRRYFCLYIVGIY